MTARAIWKASLALGEAAVPVKLYAAVEEPEAGGGEVIDLFSLVRERLREPRGLRAWRGARQHVR